MKEICEDKAFIAGGKGNGWKDQFLLHGFIKNIFHLVVLLKLEIKRFG